MWQIRYANSCKYVIELLDKFKQFEILHVKSFDGLVEVGWGTTVLQEDGEQRRRTGEATDLSFYFYDYYIGFNPNFEIWLGQF
jgi:hypothetical protein